MSELDPAQMIEDFAEVTGNLVKMRRQRDEARADAEQLREALLEARSRYQARNDAYVEQVAEADRLREAIRKHRASRYGDAILRIRADSWDDELYAALGRHPR